ncbi:BHH_G0040920.mRNA.1.CDS.1 [Saccharomyces cerevisiae]|nr:BDC_1c_G0041240.mRNA.1.CDS.1 [Saccharomyces cerevisiae]CAI4675945.1 BHH_G0040920.mRNA.1.CDS.1 [Saccharomyces cerevisiae]CAI7269477.1 BHH_G0040920.mRNA.1.CDS.1 [Saccharomyces cerevisiae]CAI7275185.1 BDC_1c_G0041240.mRNA.1.CDS.1 [Saccharomyces cerevisiae]
MATTDIISLVKNNLLYFQMWTEVEILQDDLSWKGNSLRLLRGRPPHKLSNDVDTEHENSLSSPRPLEFILPINMSQYKENFLTLECLSQTFTHLCNPSTERILLAIINDDGTIVYYFVYKGVRKPKRN